MCEQVLTIISCFVLILAVYDTFEYACCYDDEKRKTIREWLIHRMQRESTTASGAGRSSDSVTELSRLLDADESLVGPEEIALDTFSASTSTTQFATNVTDDDVVIELENGQLLS